MVYGAIREKFIKLCYNQNHCSIDKPEFMEVVFCEYTKAKTQVYSFVVTWMEITKIASSLEKPE